MYDRMKYDIGAELLKIDKYGKVIYLLGNAQYGAVNEPTKLTSYEQAKNIYGHYGNILSAYRHIRDVNEDCEIIAVKVSGTHSVLGLNVNVDGGIVEKEALIFKSIYANDLYNKISVQLGNEYIMFNFPTELGGGQRIYYYADYEILGLLIKAINDDFRNGLNFVKAYTTISQGTTLTGALYPVNPDLQYLAGGTDGVGYTKNQLWYCLEQTYQLLESEYMDIVIPLGAFMDDLHPKYYYGESTYKDSIFYLDNRDYLNINPGGVPLTFHAQLLNFCKKQAKYGLITHGIMGMNKLRNIEALKDPTANYITKLVMASPVGSKVGFDYRGLTENDRFYVSVVAGDLKYSDDEVDNGYTGYAGLLSSINVADSTTNKPLGSNVAIIHEFDTDELKTLADLGVTSFRNSVLKGLVVSNGVTLAPSDKDLHYICNVRMIQLTMTFVRLQMDKFIGEDIYFLEKNNIINLELTTILDDLKSKGVLKDYRYTLNIDFASGKLTINLSLQTLYMVEFVKASTEANFDANS